MPKPFKKTGAGWKKLEAALKPNRYNAIMEKHLVRATSLNGQLAVAKVRDEIKKGGYAPNKPLTIALKGSTKPLVGRTAQLWQAITHQKIDKVTVFVGVLKTNGIYNIAVAVHEGVAIKVTERMRGLFFVLWQVSEGRMPISDLRGRAKELWDQMPGGWKPLLASTTAITIPSRPFIKQAFADKELRNKAKTNWQQAMRAAHKEIAGN